MIFQGKKNNKQKTLESFLETLFMSYLNVLLERNNEWKVWFIYLTTKFYGLFV